jgi:hypothetical protein
VDSKTWLLGGGILALIVAVGFACYMWGAAEERAKIAAAPRDTVLVLYEHETPPYTVSGQVVSKPLIAKPVIKDSAQTLDSAFNNCEHTILLNTIGELNAQLAQYRDVDSFSEDSSRYTLAVTWDGSKPINQRFWRWLQIKPVAYSDTLQTVTQTVAQQGKMDWSWLIAALCVGATIMALLYSVAFK